jgi:hypothetical protein
MKYEKPFLRFKGRLYTSALKKKKKVKSLIQILIFLIKSGDHSKDQ